MTPDIQGLLVAGYEFECCQVLPVPGEIYESFAASIQAKEFVVSVVREFPWIDFELVVSDCHRDSEADTLERVGGVVLSVHHLRLDEGKPSGVADPPNDAVDWVALIVVSVAADNARTSV